MNRGVSNTIKEFSSDFDDLFNTWKYVVEQNEDGIVIKLMEMEDGNWKEEKFIIISSMCAERLFKEIASCIERKEFAF